MRLSFEHEADDPRQTDFVADLRERYAALIDDHQPELVVVVGGDGALLRALHRRTALLETAPRPIRFLGIGRGRLNFLMNPSSVARQLTELNPAELPYYRVHPLWVEADGKRLGPSYNDVVLGNGIADCHSFRLDSSDGIFSSYELRGSGICVSTPLGSTAFNANNRGAVLPLDQPLLSVTGIVPDRDLNEIFAGNDLRIAFESRRGAMLFMDGQRSVSLGKSGSIAIHRDEERWMELAFINDGEFSHRRIELLKAKRKP